jgi:hypothetical protein
MTDVLEGGLLSRSYGKIHLFRHFAFLRSGCGSWPSGREGHSLAEPYFIQIDPLIIYLNLPVPAR